MRSWIRVITADTRGQAQISGRKIYILPTGYGFLFGILLLLLLIGSINYSNNPAFLLTFLLTGMFVPVRSADSLAGQRAGVRH